MSIAYRTQAHTPLAHRQPENTAPQLQAATTASAAVPAVPGPLRRGFATSAVHAGQEPDPLTGAVIPPIYQTSTFTQTGVETLTGGYEYSRGGNPTRCGLETQLAALEGGTAAFAFASASRRRMPCCGRR